jgi:hypothetical protein
MRHLYGVALAVALAAAVFFAASWGYLRLLRLPGGALPANGGSLIHDHAVLQGFGVLAAVGLLAGLLMVIPWVSPLAPGLPGLALLAWTGLYLDDVKDAIRFIPLKRYDYGVGFEALLIDGVLAAVGLALIIPMFIPSRWLWRATSTQASPVMPGSDLLEPYQGYTTPAETTTVDNSMLTDWSQTRPQAQIDPGPPPPQSQAPWGPA